MTGSTSGPTWLRTPASEVLEDVITSGEKSILLYGPPRTGKTYLVDQLVPRSDHTRETIQIHDGWGYKELVLGFRPDEEGKWDWRNGAILRAIRDGKKTIVLEEINRTETSQALGEVFSLLETDYRGPKSAITLPNGEELWIPEDVLFIATMNTVDRSTEDLDDALMGRMAAVEFPPDPVELRQMLDAAGLDTKQVEGVVNVFAAIQEQYPLGHAYFAGLEAEMTNRDFIRYYRTRIRPVVSVALGNLHKDELAQIDNLVDELFPL